MADLQESSIWENGIYQLEETDVVRGGDPLNGGISNLQGLQLANRTSWLKNKRYTYDSIDDIAINADVSKTLTGETPAFVLSIYNYGKTLTLDIADLPIGREILITTLNLVTSIPQNISTLGNVVKIKLANNGKIYSGPYTEGQDAIYLYTGESIKFMKFFGNNNENHVLIIENSSNINQVGEICQSMFPISFGLAASGQLVERIQYPRLWKKIQDANIAIPENIWHTGNMLTGLPDNKGFFSQGNGTTTFRMPDLRGVFLRSRDNGRGFDLDRIDNEGSFQGTKGIKHKHKVFDKTTIVQGNQLMTNLNSVRIPVLSATPSNTVTDTHLTETENALSGNEARPANIAFTTYIKY